MSRHATCCAPFQVVASHPSTVVRMAGMPVGVLPSFQTGETIKNVGTMTYTGNMYHYFEMLVQVRPPATRLTRQRQLTDE